MTQPIKLLEEKPTARIEEVVGLVVDEAKKVFAMPYGGYYPKATEIGRATLRYRHLGLTSWDVTATAAGWVQITATVPEDIYIIVEGFAFLGGNTIIEEVDFTVGGTKLPVNDITDYMVLTDEKVMYLQEPFVAAPKSELIVGYYCNAAGTQTFRLLGEVIGKRAFLITRTP